MIYLFWTLLCLGYGDQARLRRNEALDEARKLSPHTLAFALCTVWIGDWAIEGVKAAPAMLRSAEEVLAISSEQSFPQWLGLGKIMRGWGLGAAGQTVDGISSLLQGLAMYRATGANLGVQFFLIVLADVYGMAAQPEQGLSRLAEADQLIETTHESWAEAELHRLRGALLLSLHKHVAAEESYLKALSVARLQTAKFWELRAATSLARLWRDQGKRSEARDLLAAVYCWFTEGFDTPVLQDAKTLLDQLA